MKYIRSFLVYLWIIVILILFLPYRWWCNRLKEKDELKGYQMLDKLVKPFCKGILILGGIKLTIKGRENIPQEGNVLFVGNHQSMLDIVTMLLAVNRPMGFVAKESLAKIRLIRAWIECIGSVFIARGESRKALQAIINSAKIVKSGHSLMIYPEGTRSKDGSLGEFKPGSLKIASRGEAAIVPVAVDGNYKVLPAGTIWVKSEKVTLTFLPPIPAAEVQAEDTTILAERIAKEIARCLEKNS